MTRVVISVLDQNFGEAVLLWRTTNRPQYALNYRFYERHSVAVLRIAEDPDLLSNNQPFALLRDSWAEPWGKKTIHYT